MNDIAQLEFQHLHRLCLKWCFQCPLNFSLWDVWYTWVIIPLQLCGSWRPFLYRSSLYKSSVYSCHLFLIFLLLLVSFHFCPLLCPFLHKMFPLYLNFYCICMKCFINDINMNFILDILTVLIRILRAPSESSCQIHFLPKSWGEFSVSFG